MPAPPAPAPRPAAVPAPGAYVSVPDALVAHLPLLSPADRWTPHEGRTRVRVAFSAPGLPVTQHGTPGPAAYVVVARPASVRAPGGGVVAVVAPEDCRPAH